jgi:DtxR family Mn-dependent transcriptional regulator
MEGNLLTLLIGAVVIAISIYMVFPQKGLIAKWKRARLDSKRVNIEDALKHLYDCEYNSSNCSLDSLAGNLSLNRDSAAKVIEKLQSMRLVVFRNDRFELTNEGRSYALRVIRVHRLWERYLADETSIGETEWHERAEEMEHILSLDETERLAAEIGNPILDPHGDPIPTAKGEIRGKIGIPLPDLRETEFARITHLEDEPQTIYAQLVAEGLYVGQQVRIIEKTDDRIKFEANGELIVLAPIFASNISVYKIPEVKNVFKSFKKLSDLKIGQSGTVVGIAKVIRGQQRRRLLDLGVVPGTKVSALIQSLGGDPTGYGIRGATIAIRKNHASQVFIKDVN